MGADRLPAHTRRGTDRVRRRGGVEDQSHLTDPIQMSRIAQPEPDSGEFMDLIALETVVVLVA